MDSILVHINDKPVEMAKAELYGLKYKPKLINKFPNNFINLTEKLNSQFNRKANPSLVMEKQDYFNIIKKMKNLRNGRTDNESFS